MTQTVPRSTPLAVFRDRDTARPAIHALEDGAVAPQSISILAPGQQTARTIGEN